MILYFADRQFNILGQATTGLPGGLTVTEDVKTEDAELGVSIFECKLPYDDETRAKAKEWAEVGNYLLRSHESENELYTIIEIEEDTKKQRIYIYAENDGMDLLNEVVGKYEATAAQPIEFYIDKYATAAGWEIGINEAEGLTRQLSWDSEQTAAARIANIAAQFDGCEISYTFEVGGLSVLKRYINIFKERGQNLDIPLRLNKDIDSIITTKSISNLATALHCTGGTPDNADEPITLLGYAYDDGDFYIDGAVLKSRNALEKWRRVFVTDSEENGGHIEKQYSYDTLSQAVLLEKAIAELKIYCDMETNYEVDIKKLPDNVRIGDRVNIVDDAGELYLSTRILTLETSVADQTNKAVLGEHLIKTSGISQKVADLAAQFAKTTISVQKAKAIANNAQAAAEEAQETANNALADAESAQAVADEAKAAADTATQSATEATAKALAAEAAVNAVEESVSSLQTTVDNAQAAADNAYTAADTATAKAEEAKTAAENATAEAAEAKTSAEVAQSEASTAVSTAETAKTTANEAKTTAETASATAAAAKADAEQAEKDVAALGDELETVNTTMQTDYARKTELTETEAALQSQISQNAAQISSTVTKLQTVDETANNAKEMAETAQAGATAAQEQANQATAEAQAAQTAADNAAQAAANAQTEADTAKAAAETAQSVADKAQADLEAAQADLATVSGRVDATEEEIATAQAAVATAQAAADKAKTDAAAAATKATEAQTTANTAVSNAATAQTVADEAARKAEVAQAAADEAKGNAEEARTIADQAAQAAADAQSTADTAKSNADAAQATADAAAQAAATAQSAADDAEAKAAKAATDLATAQQNLADVTSRVDATEEEVAAAQLAVETAQAAADKAKLDAVAAQNTADTAKADAATAQAAADTAKAAADDAQKAADDAQAAADKAQEDVNALEVRVTTAETKISQNAEQIQLAATKEEVTTTLGGYYTKEETDAALTVKANEITSTVSSTYTTKQEFQDLEIGGRNIIRGTGTGAGWAAYTSFDAGTREFVKSTTATSEQFIYCQNEFTLEAGQEYTLSLDAKQSNTKDGGMDIYILPATWQTTGIALNKAVREMGTEYIRIVLTFTPSPDATSLENCQLRFDNNGSIAEGTEAAIWIKNVKLEKGNRATDWTPAPEDVAEDIGAAQDTANNAAASISAVESKIQQLADNIAMLVTDENSVSLMTQNADGGWTFSTTEIQSTINNTSALLDDLIKEFGSVEIAVEILKSALADISTKTNYVNIDPYFTYTDENGEEITEPGIKLGNEEADESGNNFNVIITNTRILFQEGSLFPTRITSEGLVTENITIENELRHTAPDNTGHYVWRVRASGNYGLQWKGVAE